MINVILISILIIASIYDLKYLIVPLWLQLILFLVVLISVPITNWIIPLILLIVFIVLDKYISKIGGADIKILLILLAYFESSLTIVIFIASLVGLIYMAVIRKNKIAFVPCILTGVICCLVLNNYLMI